MEPLPDSPERVRARTSGSTVARHSFVYLFARGLPALINLLAMAIYTRLLAPENYGEYALVIAGVGLANMVLFQWLRLSVLRFLPAHDHRLESFFSTITAGYASLVIVSGILGAVLLILVADSISRSLVLLGVLLLWIQAFHELNLSVTVIQLAPARYGVLSIVKTATAAAVGGTLAYLGFGAEGLIIGLMGGMLIATVLQARIWGTVRVRLIDRSLFRELLVYGLPLSATFVLGFVVSGSDRFLIGWLLGSSYTGLYAAGYDLASQSLGVALMVVNLAGYPLAVRALEQSGEAAARQQLTRNVILLLAIAVPGTAGLMVLAPRIAAVFLGEEFRGAATELIPWIALGSLLAGVRSYHFDLSFQLGRRTISQVWVTLAAAVANVALNLLWIPLYGVAGAAYATVVAYGVALLLSWGMGRRTFRLPFPVLEAVKILCATGGMIGVLWGIRSHAGIGALLMQVLVGALAYGVLALGLNVGDARSRATAVFRSNP